MIGRIDPPIPRHLRVNRKPEAPAVGDKNPEESFLEALAAAEAHTERLRPKLKSSTAPVVIFDDGTCALSDAERRRLAIEAYTKKL